MWKNRKIKDPKRSEEITEWCHQHKKKHIKSFMIGWIKKLKMRKT